MPTEALPSHRLGPAKLSEQRLIPSQAGAAEYPPLPLLNHTPTFLGPKSHLRSGFLSKLTNSLLLLFLMPKRLSVMRAGTADFWFTTAFSVPTPMSGT